MYCIVSASRKGGVDAQARRVPVAALMLVSDFGSPSALAQARRQGYRVKRISACGGCLGDDRRRRTRQPAISCGEPANGP